MRLKVAVGVVIVALACGSVGSGGGSVGSPLTINQRECKVMDAVGVPVFCDPDFYPVARYGGEQSNADSFYPQIRADGELYSAIIAHENLPSGDLNEAQKVTVYRAFKR